MFSYPLSKSFWASIAFFFVIFVGYFVNVLFKTDFHYTYFLDDTYIHLSIAKNFALHGVWGITSHEFSSTSSSPLYTSLISLLIFVFGNNDQIPLYINILLGVGVVYFLHRYYADLLNKTESVLMAVLFTLLFAVLHLQLLSGMEHLLHVLLLVVNVFCLSKINNSRSVSFAFYGTLFCMGTVRFESMFYFAILAFSLLLIRKWKMAAGVILAGFVPVVIFCAFNYQQDGYFFPNSVVVKGTGLDFNLNVFSQIKRIFLDKLILNGSFYKIGFFPILMCCIFIFRDFKGYNFPETLKRNFLLIVFSLLMICHSLFADLKGAFRYEAYILVGFSMALIPKLKFLFDDHRAFIKKEWLLSGLIGINCFLLIYKFIFAHLMLDNGGKNVYEQQVQSAKFLNTYYNESKVVANDIGAITYYTDIHLLDIVGLGSKEMIPFAKSKNGFDERFENFLSRFSEENKFDMAIIYEDWFDGHIPEAWKKVATLKIENKISVYGNEVSVYCIDLDKRDQLKNNIKHFNWNKNVKVSIID